MYLLCYFFVAEICSDGSYNPFFFYIIITVDNCNYFSREFFNGSIHSQNIGVLFLTVGRYYSLYISVVNRINYVVVVWMPTPKRSVYSYFNNASDHKRLRQKILLFRRRGYKLRVL